MIILESSIGNIHIKLDEKKAPISSQNFIDYVNDGFYNGTIFHRVIQDFMIQGGGLTKNIKEKITKTQIKNESKNGLKNKKYMVAMARTMLPHSASSQFFINTNDNAFLDFPGQDGWGYCVFGKVLKGKDIVDKINQIATGNAARHNDMPNDVIIIKKAYKR